MSRAKSTSGIYRSTKNFRSLEDYDVQRVVVGVGKKAYAAVNDIDISPCMYIKMRRTSRACVLRVRKRVRRRNDRAGEREFSDVRANSGRSS